jgi:hypothetical protein
MLVSLSIPLLWTIDQAAKHWGVSASRARATLSGRGIRRISGYLVDEVQSVELRQGARTDLSRSTLGQRRVRESLSITTVAEAIREAADDHVRLRIFFEFIRGAGESGRAALQLIAVEPPWTTDQRFDALLAAAAEHIAAQRNCPGPLWTVAGDRFLGCGWWVSDLPSARALALVWTPAVFRRRGIYLDRHDLTSDGVRPMPEPVFDHDSLLQAFALVAAQLERKGVVGQVHVVGGAAKLLAYHSRVTTRDVDALFRPGGPMVDAMAPCS